MDYQLFVARARERAQNERHQARWQTDGSQTVRSESIPGERWEQHFEITPGNAIWFHCTCPSGQFRGHLLVPCKHATRWGDRMVRDLGVTMVRLENEVYWWGGVAGRAQVELTWAADWNAKRRFEELYALQLDRALTSKERSEFRTVTAKVEQLRHLGLT